MRSPEELALMQEREMRFDGEEAAVQMALRDVTDAEIDKLARAAVKERMSHRWRDALPDPVLAVKQFRNSCSALHTRIRADITSERYQFTQVEKPHQTGGRKLYDYHVFDRAENAIIGRWSASFHTKGYRLYDRNNDPVKYARDPSTPDYNRSPVVAANKSKFVVQVSRYREFIRSVSQIAADNAVKAAKAAARRAEEKAQDVIQSKKKRAERMYVALCNVVYDVAAMTADEAKADALALLKEIDAEIERNMLAVDNGE